MKTFIRRSDGVFASFEGMTLNAITDMLDAQNLTFDVIDEATYSAGVAALSQH